MHEVNRQVQTVLLNEEPVELFKILKFQGLASSGAHAKSLIDEGLVLVNGTIETRRRRKIQDNDLVQIGEVTLRMTVSP
ncbi:MAG: RNA-binding S4 domain-containing protein [Granulosicoccus sp.]